MKHCLLFLGFSALSLVSHGQDSLRVTIEECYLLAQKNYPMSKQKDLLEQSREFSLSNASKSYLPQISLNGQATIQSDVTAVSIPIPNVNIPVPDKDQYKIYGEINQPLTDVTIIRQQKQMINANSSIEVQKLEVELYKLKERINQIFFGILLIDEQAALVTLLKKDLNAGLGKINASIANGTAMKSNADVVKAELLKAEQRAIELRSARKAFLEMLGMFIGKQLGENTNLEKPLPKIIASAINRSELSLLENQKKTLEIQHKLLNAKSYPRANLFLQSGFGKPALNMFSTDFEFYYIGGIRLTWQFSSFYTLKKDRKLISIHQNLFDLQKETFLFNTNLALKQQGEEIKKLQELIEKDSEIIALRSSIKQSATDQLGQGVITTTDYLREVNAEDQAKQNQLLHKIQLLMAQYNYQTISGN